MQERHLWRHIIMDMKQIHFHGGVEMEETVLQDMLGLDQCAMIHIIQT